MALRLDMSKAHDRVEWIFLYAVMTKMGFHSKRISLIMRCIYSISYFILINGSSQTTFQATMGIRQGDPLSLYLFILCSEALSALLNQVREKKLITSIPIGIRQNFY